jgi:hypothetical protein
VSVSSTDKSVELEALLSESWEFVKAMEDKEIWEREGGVEIDDRDCNPTQRYRKKR